MASIRLRWPSMKSLMAGIGIGVTLSVAVPALSLLGARLASALSGEQTTESSEALDEIG